MLLIRLTLIFYLIFLNQVKCQLADYFLPKNVKPLRYVITIIPYNQTNYKGNVNIQLEAIEETPNITLHTKSIEIKQSNVKILNKNEAEVKLNNTIIDQAKDFFVINLNENLIKGNIYNLTISEFVGSLTETKFGLFLAKYQDINGTDNYFALTEFEPMHARKAFPCFDEPNLKAKFIVRIMRSSWSNSASNTPLQETIDLGNGSYIDVFKETPLMPTYLVAFIISNFKFTKQNGIIRMLVQPEHVDDGGTDFVLEESVKVLHALEEYTGIKYPLDKLDLVAVPEGYFVDGAMENWGLITYSDKYIICPKSYPIKETQRCLTYTAHEFAHQWFGNLATQKTWNYIWLSEGFASYFQYYIADIVKPSWRIKEQYFLEEYQVSLRMDGMSITEAIDFEFKSADSFPQPDIYYRKGSAIIRMVEHVLTDEIHRNGLRIYLKNNQYKNTQPVDVYNSYEQALKDANATHLLGNFTFHEMISTWTKNPSYPLVSVTRDYEIGKVTFSQKLFNLEGDDANTIWYIPITYALEKSANFQITTTDTWLTTENDTIDVGIGDEWILVNKNATGYYRVNYDERNWARIINFMKDKDYIKIPPLNRAQLLYDSYYLAVENYIGYEIFFNLTTYLEQEIDYIPISAFLDILNEADVLTVQQKNYNLTKRYVTKLLSGITTYLKLNDQQNDTHVERLTRTLVQKIMCEVDQDDCVNEAIKKFLEWKLTGRLDMDSYVKKRWLCSAMKKASLQSWNFLLEHYFKSKDNDTRTTYIFALTCVENPALLQRFINEIFNLNNAMSPQDRFIGLSNSLQTTIGIELFIDYIKSNDLDERHCIYFSEAEGMFAPAQTSQLALISSIRKKIKHCIPVSFFKVEDSNFMEELNIWYNKYFDE